MLRRMFAVLLPWSLFEWNCKTTTTTTKKPHRPDLIGSCWDEVQSARQDLWDELHPTLGTRLFQWQISTRKPRGGKVFCFMFLWTDYLRHLEYSAHSMIILCLLRWSDFNSTLNAFPHRSNSFLLIVISFPDLNIALQKKIVATLLLFTNHFFPGIWFSPSSLYIYFFKLIVYYQRGVLHRNSILSHKNFKGTVHVWKLEFKIGEKVHSSFVVSMSKDSWKLAKRNICWSVLKRQNYKMLWISFYYCLKSQEYQVSIRGYSMRLDFPPVLQTCSW